jgi:hypothetical protein
MRSREKAWGAAGHVAGVMNQELPCKWVYAPYH